MNKFRLVRQFNATVVESPEIILSLEFFSINEKKAKVFASKFAMFLQSQDFGPDYIGKPYETILFDSDGKHICYIE
jgi:hypothetical protein